MYSMAGDKTHAIDAVEEVARLKRANAPGYGRVPWEKIYFQEGTIQFWYRDFDQALENLKKVAAAANELDLNTGVYTYLRIGQIYDLKGQRTQAARRNTARPSHMRRNRMRRRKRRSVWRRRIGGGESALSSGKAVALRCLTRK